MNVGRSVSETRETVLLTQAPSDLQGRIVTLAFLSGQIPAPKLSETLARSLCAETDESVVVVRLEPQEAPANSGGAQSQLCLNGEFHLPPEVPRTEAGFHFLSVGIRSDPPTAAGIESLVGKLSGSFRYVLIETQVNQRPTRWFLELLHHSNLAYLFLKGTTENVHHLDLVLREARTRCHNGGVHVKPVACLAAGERFEGHDLIAQRVGCPVHLFVHDCPAPDNGPEHNARFGTPGSFRADVRRLAREIGGCLVGLALSSGAAKGFAHIGVIQVLEENGIEVDVVAGASMGAYVGSIWAYGCEGPELERLARELEGRWSMWKLIDPSFPPRRGFLRGLAVKKRLMRSLGHARFSDLKRPLRVAATNLATLERVVFSAGEVATAVHASVAVPGICVPITIDGDTYTDGGIVDPLPVDVLREMGVTRVIAVNVIPTPDRIRYGIQAELELARHQPPKRRGLFRKVPPLDLQMNYFARGNLLEVLMRSVHGAQIRMAEASCLQADVVVRPNIYDDCWLDYRNPGKFIALGREAAERRLEEIRALTGRKEVVHERQPAPEPVASII